jgi:hypothetical protein
LEHQTDRASHLFVIVNDPDFFHSKCALMLSAVALFIPLTADNSSIVAALILSTEPKCFKRDLRRVGPMPGIESNCEAMPNFVRFLRCAVIP